MLQECVQEVLDPSEPLEHVASLDSIGLEDVRKLLNRWMLQIEIR